MLKAVNLSLSNRCCASCLFCPTFRGQRIQGNMKYMTAVRLVEQISGLPFLPERMEVGENGDALFNPNLTPILFYVRFKLPKIHINLVSNFFNMDNETAQALIKEKLIDSVQVNIDGHDKASYEAQKGLNYEKVIKNLKNFVDLCKQYQSPITIGVNVLTAQDYVDCIRRNFNGNNPINAGLNGGAFPETSLEQIRGSLPFIPPEKIQKTVIFGWAERAQSEYRKPTAGCPQLSRIESEAFIAPDGSWYACCLDANNNLVLGNILDESLWDIYNGKRRQQLLDRLRTGKFDEIGFPCNTVSCCEVLR